MADEPREPDAQSSGEELPRPEHGDLNGDRMEALSLEELDAFMQRARTRASNLRETEQAKIREQAEELDEIPVPIEAEQVARLSRDFFPELPQRLQPRRLVQGIIFDFDGTLARLTRPIEDLMAEGARTAEAYMRASGMQDLPCSFWESIVEARLFAQTKSDDEQEEHVANDTLSFLLQFFGYPASKMDLDVLHQAVDLFYAPEMSSWEAMPGAHALLRQLTDEGYRIALIANYSCDRVFQRMVDYTGLRPYLDVCLSSAAVEWRKPGKEIYDSVLTRWDVESYELVCVGDSLKHDVAGGLELGAQTVHCRMIPLAEDQRIIDSITPDALIDHLIELPDLIHRWT